MIFHISLLPYFSGGIPLDRKSPSMATLYAATGKEDQEAHEMQQPLSMAIIISLALSDLHYLTTKSFPSHVDY